MQGYIMVNPYKIDKLAAFNEKHRNCHVEDNSEEFDWEPPEEYPPCAIGPFDDQYAIGITLDAEWSGMYTIKCMGCGEVEYLQSM